MTQEDKQLLLKDLCARLPYGVKVQCMTKSARIANASPLTETLNAVLYGYVEEDNIELKPYLRHLSTMTDEEDQEYDATFYREDYGGLPSPWSATYETFDWLNAHHFDFRGLISMGLLLKHRRTCIKMNRYGRKRTCDLERYT